jgi:hypothetical protein
MLVHVVCVIVLACIGGKREEKEGGQQALDNGLQNVQLTLSMGPARMEVCGNLERATILRRRVVLHYCSEHHLQYLIIHTCSFIK